MAIIDRVKYDGPANILVWRHPPDDLTWGTQLIVNQSQEAIFFKGGQALDVLGPGTHTLKSANIPLLRGVIKAPFGGETPFAAEVYFINKAVNLEVKWGTPTPIPILDPKYNVFLPVRAHGQMGIRVADSRKFVTQLVGTIAEFTSDNLTGYFRGVVLTKAKDHIAETIVDGKVDLLTISTKLEELSKALHGRMKEDFAAFGVELVNFFLQSVDLPEEDSSVQSLKKMLAEKAEISVLGADNYRMKRTFDTMEKAAGNEGGGGMGAGMGLGMGFGAGGTMGQMMAQAIGTQAPKQVVACAKCSAQIAASSKFCPECGSPVITATGKCPDCHADVAAGAKFCNNCGKKLL